MINPHGNDEKYKKNKQGKGLMIKTVGALSETEYFCGIYQIYFKRFLVQ